MQTLIAGKEAWKEKVTQPEFDLTIQPHQNEEQSDQATASTAKSRDFDQQVEKLQICAAILNLFTSTGHAANGPYGINHLGIGVIRPTADLCNKAVLNKNRAGQVG